MQINKASETNSSPRPTGQFLSALKDAFFRQVDQNQPVVSFTSWSTHNTQI